MEKCLTIILDKFDSKTKKRQSDLHFVFQETAASLHAHRRRTACADLQSHQHDGQHARLQK